MFLLFLGTGIGLLLAIIPGVIFYLTFHFAVYRIIEREISIKQAFKESLISSQGGDGICLECISS